MKDTFSTDSLNYLFIQVSKAHRIRTGELMAQLGLHVGQEWILIALWAQDGQTLSQLVEKLEVQPPTVTKMVQRMEAIKLVRREISPEDSRASLIFLTPKGKALQNKLDSVWQEVEAQFLAGMSKAELASFRAILLKARENLSPQQKRES
jgi:MarR family transcriptional regulator, organic hydroperoxide resistance regulator